MMKSLSISLMVLVWLITPVISAAQEAPQAVGVDEVRMVPVARAVPILGRLVAVQAGDVAARVSGAVAELVVQVGDRVVAGDVMARLQAERFEAQDRRQAAEVAVRQAELATKRAELNIAQQELQRLERLKANKSAAFRQANYDDKRIQIAVVQSQVAEAKARLNAAEAERRRTVIDLEETQILAPYTGIVSLLRTEVGAYLRIGDPILALINDQSMEVEADVPADRIATLAPGLPLSATIGGQEVALHVRAVIPEENPLTRTRAVRFQLSAIDDRAVLAANQTVTVQIPIASERQALSVHKDAVLNRRGQDMVFLIADQKAVPRPVQLGHAIGNRFEILQGLAAGDLVVIRGNERLRPQQPVTF